MVRMVLRARRGHDGRISARAKSVGDRPPPPGALQLHFGDVGGAGGFDVRFPRSPGEQPKHELTRRGMAEGEGRRSSLHDHEALGDHRGFLVVAHEVSKQASRQREVELTNRRGCRLEARGGLGHLRLGARPAPAVARPARRPSGRGADAAAATFPPRGSALARSTAEPARTPDVGGTS
jgi:hypothetical protein